MCVEGREDVGKGRMAMPDVNRCSPSSEELTGPANELRAKPRCTLKSIDTQIKSPCPAPIRNTSYQGFWELKARNLLGSMTSIASGINKMKLFRRIPEAILWPWLGATSKATMCPEMNKVRKLRSRPQGRPVAGRRLKWRAIEKIDSRKSARGPRRSEDGRPGWHPEGRGSK